MERIYTPIDEAEFKDIVDTIAALQRRIDILDPLEPAERKHLAKMHNHRYTFVKQSLYLAKTDPILVPTFCNLPNAEKAFILRSQLDQIDLRLKELATTVDNMRALTGSESYSTGLSIYRLAKQGAKKGITVMLTAYQQLKVFFNTDPTLNKRKRSNSDQ
jgi:hypothetical protein